MIPVHPEASLDILPAESVVVLVRDLLKTVRNGMLPPAVLHLSTGEEAWKFGEWISLANEVFREEEPAWRRGQIREPVRATWEEFELFRTTVRNSGDLLFTKMLETVDAVLPALATPKTYQNDVLRAFSPEAAEVDVENLSRRVISRLCRDKAVRL
jgi:hypothetical protein